MDRVCIIGPLDEVELWEDDAEVEREEVDEGEEDEELLAAVLEVVWTLETEVVGEELDELVLVVEELGEELRVAR